jgi:isoleucyl-tRNA synthetase
VLATALFDRPAFANCVSHGNVLGDDGRKMSKSLNNYPDPREMFDTHGADAMRWHLLSSPILRGGDGMVTEEGMRDTVRHVLLPLWNSWYFLSLYANAADYQGRVNTESTNVLDRYVLAKTRALVVDLTPHSTTSTCSGRARWSETTSTSSRTGTSGAAATGSGRATPTPSTRCTRLSVLTRLIAPLLPLVAEEIHAGLHGDDAAASVHLTDWPTPDELPADDELVATMDLVRDVCSATLSVRKAHQRRVRLPLSTVTVASADAARLGEFRDVIADEVNVRHVELTRTWRRWPPSDCSSCPLASALGSARTSSR